jgi:anti-anti-sigma factor
MTRRCEPAGRPDTLDKPGVLSVTEVLRKSLGLDPALLPKQEGAAMFGLEVTTRRQGDCAVLSLRGELDIQGAPRLAAALAAAAVGDARIVVDLADLDFVDCSGFNVLLRALKMARRAGGQLSLAAPRRQALTVLTHTGLIAVFSVAASVDEAVDGATRSGPVLTGAT